ncbi:MAG: rod shape-determining protein MreD [Pirellulales bacterium]|nr:rod shape-determining protein MreD [Pirellulales bacterium]
MWSILLVPILYVAAVVQTSLVDVLRIGRVEPDVLVFVGLVWVLCSRGPYRFLAAGAAGLVGDLLCSGTVGPGCAAGLAVGYLLVRADARIAIDRLASRLLAVWVGATFMILVEVLLRGILGQFVSWAHFGLALRLGLGAGLYTAVISLPVLMVVGWLHSAHVARWRRRRDGLY